MPINYKDYPKDWKKTVQRIKDRAENCCEFCGVHNYSVGYRDKNGKFLLSLNNRGVGGFKAAAEFAKMLNQDMSLKEGKYIVIVLTTAHLDHDEHNHAVTDDRLAALCQKCHLDYDRPEKKRRRQAKKKQMKLF